MVRSWAVVAAAFLLSAAIVGGSLIAANTIDYVKTFDSSVLTVTGSTDVQITSDQIKWSGTFGRDVPVASLQQGYAQMLSDADIVSKFLADQGVAKDEITMSSILQSPIQEQCGNPPRAGCTNAIVAYRLTQEVTINSAEVDKITGIAQKTSQLIDQGVIFSGRNPEYFYSKLPDLRVQLFAGATKDAQARAEQIAGSTGARLGHLVSASTGVIQITPPNSTQISDQGTYDTSTIQKKVTGVVRAQFTLGR
ncbi:MAG TPA: SIMPL domain-containing protein [Chloroflexota bacterium]|nr:SIMPL domain-containing protein [Chloroflexota bacterium]